jgi:hypothetical protein
MKIATDRVMKQNVKVNSLMDGSSKPKDYFDEKTNK